MMPVSGQRAAMGTTVQVVAHTNAGNRKEQVEDAIALAFDEIERLEAMLSAWRPSSDIGRINLAEGRPVGVQAETLAVLERSLWASRISDGAFDITFEVMNDVWRFGDAEEKSPRVPSDDEVAKRRKLIDYRRVQIDHVDRTVCVPSGMRIGLGGIGKGYIVDRAADVLRDNGVDSFFVQAGGDLLGVGHKPSGDPWTSGVQDPRGPRGSFFAVLGFSDHAFSTAGDYARAFFVDGRRYHHIIDPRTGYPASACRSVTVWAPDATTADALDDAVFVLGPEAGLALVEKTPGVGAVIVDAENRVIVSKRLRGRLTVLQPPTDGP
jgi:thiamine biosynthesis lipoprotein